MKSIKLSVVRILGFILVLTFLLGCHMYQELPVEYDYSYSGNYKNYNTFSLIDNSSHEFGYLIDNSIVAHMSILGYDLDYKSPDLLISYTIFEDSLQLRGYHQPAMRSWLKKTKKLENYYPKKIEMFQGTLYLQIFDTKKQQAIWQGYVTDKYGKEILTNKTKIHQAIRSILNEYKVFSRKYVKNKVSS